VASGRLEEDGLRRVTVGGKWKGVEQTVPDDQHSRKSAKFLMINIRESQHRVRASLDRDIAVRVSRVIHFL